MPEYFQMVFPKYFQIQMLKYFQIAFPKHLRGTIIMTMAYVNKDVVARAATIFLDAEMERIEEAQERLIDEHYIVEYYFFKKQLTREQVIYDIMEDISSSIEWHGIREYNRKNRGVAARVLALSKTTAGENIHLSDEAAFLQGYV